MTIKMTKDTLFNCLSKIIDNRGKTPKKLGGDWSNNGYRAISANHVKFNGLQKEDSIRYVSEKMYKKWMKEEIKRGDILLTSEAPAGQVMIWDSDEKIVLSQRLFALRVNEKLDNKYLKYYLQSKTGQQEILTKMSGSTVFGISVKMFDLINVYYPHKSTQQKIAHVLSVIDEKIENGDRQNKVLENLAKTIYDYWFLQFDFPDENGKPYKSSGGKMVYNSELKREIPAGWEVKTVSNLLQFNPPYSLSKDKVSSYIDMNNIPVSGFMTGNIQEKKYNGGIKFKNGDVVMARITPCLENGKTGLITLLKDDEIGFGSTEFIVIRGKNTSLSCYSACLARSDSFRKFAISNMRGTSGRKRVDYKILETFLIPIPENNLLSKFENMVSKFFQISTINAFQNQKLKELRDWLLPMLMNGQIKVE